MDTYLRELTADELEYVGGARPKDAGAVVAAFAVGTLLFGLAGGLVAGYGTMAYEFTK